MGQRTDFFVGQSLLSVRVLVLFKSWIHYRWISQILFLNGGFTWWFISLTVWLIWRREWSIFWFNSLFIFVVISHVDSEIMIDKSNLLKVISCWHINGSMIFVITFPLFRKQLEIVLEQLLGLLVNVAIDWTFAAQQIVQT